MAVTIVKAKTEAEKKQEQLDSIDLLWAKSLRRMVLPATPKSSNSSWKKMSPDCCKVYIMIWAMTSTMPTTAATGQKLNTEIELKKVEKSSGLINSDFMKAIHQLSKLNLVKLYSYGDGFFASLIYDLSPAEMGTE